MRFIELTLFVGLLASGYSGYGQDAVKSEKFSCAGSYPIILAVRGLCGVVCAGSYPILCGVVPHYSLYFVHVTG